MTTQHLDTDRTKDGSTIELLSFLVAGQDYSVDIMSVREIRSGTKATTLPHAPDFMRGVINLRGAVLPIIDLATRLDMQGDTNQERNVIIVVSVADKTIGLMVDAVSDILAIEEDKLQNPPDLTANQADSFVSALTIVDNRMIRVLDLSAVLPSDSEEAA